MLKFQSFGTVITRDNLNLLFLLFLICYLFIYLFIFYLFIYFLSFFHMISQRNDVLMSALKQLLPCVMSHSETKTCLPQLMLLLQYFSYTGFLNHLSYLIIAREVPLFLKVGLFFSFHCVLICQRNALNTALLISRWSVTGMFY